MAKNDTGPREDPPPTPRRKLSPLDRAILAAVGEGRTVGRDDDPAATKYPEVWKWLTQTADAANNYVLQPAVLSVQLGPEGVIASLNHRDLKVSCKVVCLALEDVWPALEAALTGENPPIVSWGKDEPRLRKRRPK